MWVGGRRTKVRVFVGGYVARAETGFGSREDGVNLDEESVCLLVKAS